MRNSDEQSLELIRFVSGISVIWNPKNPDYFENDPENDAWSDIAIVVNTRSKSIGDIRVRFFFYVCHLFAETLVSQVMKIFSYIS